MLCVLPSAILTPYAIVGPVAPPAALDEGSATTEADSMTPSPARCAGAAGALVTGAGVGRSGGVAAQAARKQAPSARAILMTSSLR
jgi:hypothetical protein